MIKMGLWNMHIFCSNASIVFTLDAIDALGSIYSNLRKKIHLNKRGIEYQSYPK